MSKKKDNSAERTRKYRERKASEQEAAAEQAEEHQKMKSLDLRFFGESSFDQNASSLKDEIQIHRLFLRALGQPDIQPGETLRELARRTWSALLAVKDIGAYASGYDLWVPAFNPRTNNFDAWF